MEDFTNCCFHDEFSGNFQNNFFTKTTLDRYFYSFCTFFFNCCYDFEDTWAKVLQCMDSLEFSKSNLHHLLWMSFKKENGCADSKIVYILRWCTYIWIMLLPTHQVHFQQRRCPLWDTPYSDIWAPWYDPGTNPCKFQPF